ncbi:MAG: hypothetical protein Q7T73_08425 [Beijerinckiaceae bacterium]|jgi:hypothetical protein|nr:hypothetical protein [Beijerinckiaceae bacterium]
MIRLFVRLVALLLMAGSFVALVLDGTRSIAAGTLTYSTLGALIAAVFPKFAELKPVLDSRLHPLVWDPGVIFVLALPACVVLALIGALLWRIARKRPPPIGYSSRP